MRITDHVEMLELETVLGDGPGRINPLFVWDNVDAILFDAGMPGMGEVMEEAAEAAHVPFHCLSKVLITHSDMDHIGSLSQIARGGRNVTVFAHEEEKPYIECDLLPIRVKQMEESAGRAGGEMRERMIRLMETQKSTYRQFRADVNTTVRDGDVLPFCGGITCIHTPGHTFGHTSYYLNRLKLLVTGDILQVTGGALTKCPDFTLVDKGVIRTSLKKLCKLDITAVVCYHGGLFEGDIIHRIEELARGYNEGNSE